MDYNNTEWVNEGGGRREEKKSIWKKLLMPLTFIGFVLFKLKGLLFPILKFLPLILKTGGTMVISLWFYAMSWGWTFALGFVLLLFIHECGHLLAAKYFGLKVGAPVFIPFMGAFIALKDQPRDAWMEAVVGIGGPLLGSIGALISFVIYLATGNLFFSALAYVGFWLNLFNLAPAGFLDGGRIVTAISRWLWIVGLVVLGFLLLTRFNLMLLLVVVMAIPRVYSLFRPKTDAEIEYFNVSPGRRLLIGTAYFGLLGLLVLGMEISHVVMTQN